MYYLVKVAVVLVSVLYQNKALELRSDVPYAVVGRSFTWICDVQGDKLPFRIDIQHEKNLPSWCGVILVICGGTTFSSRLSCGCVNQNKRIIYYTITNVRTVDEGMYMCKNSDGKTSTPTFLPVYYGPTKIETSPSDRRAPITMVEGDTSTWTCKVSCNPPCVVTWFKQTTGDNELVSPTGNLTFVNIDRSLNGTQYVCKAEHPILGNAALTKTMKPIRVYYPPSISQLNTDQPQNTANEMSRVTINCDVVSVPKSNISWFRTRSEGREISSDDILVIPEATCAHTDNYTCTADNGIGKPVSRTISLDILCLPRIDPENAGNKHVGGSVVVEFGKTTNLSIFVIALPLPTFTWYRNYPSGVEQPVTNFRTRQVDTDLSSMLIIENMTAPDYGSYKVYVENSVGIRSRLFELLPVALNNTFL